MACHYVVDSLPLFDAVDRHDLARGAMWSRIVANGRTAFLWHAEQALIFEETVLQAMPDDEQVELLV